MPDNNDISSLIGNVFIVGGAGFVGSHFVDRLLDDIEVSRVTILDNFSSGSRWHLEHHRADKRLNVIEADVRNIDLLIRSMRGHATVIHLASNPDIAAASTNPAIDFDQGTLLTHCVAEAARISKISKVLYASGSGVYGDIGDIEASEDFGPLTPVSTYAASKLAGEALLSAYAYMFGIEAIAFRFGNIVGPRQTHGVGFDFVRRLTMDSSKLTILGDGRQSKSYVYVKDIVEAVFLANEVVKKPFEVFNVATGDYISVNEIATIACEVVGLQPDDVEFIYTGGNRGWKGDVPVVRLSSDRIRAIGWTPTMNCAESMRLSMTSMHNEFRSHRT